ncbi:hypothetical protein HPP92_023281 [Vanilla planifolia]|uniref:Uncharacterized protein n=1 Tax=Vanilla planifolia TaxID=51239 RepID=A0A835PWB3_VANPL|nr:hypothetical protein HPP92_023281 [Vanilla planifolia]
MGPCGYPGMRTLEELFAAVTRFHQPSRSLSSWLLRQFALLRSLLLIFVVIAARTLLFLVSYSLRLSAETLLPSYPILPEEMLAGSPPERIRESFWLRSTVLTPDDSNLHPAERTRRKEAVEGKGKRLATSSRSTHKLLQPMTSVMA